MAGSSSWVEMPGSKRSLIELLEETGRVAVLYHWDSDGISSATIIVDFLKSNGLEYSLHVPRIGYYSYDGLPIDEIKHSKADALIILDYALKQHVLDKLEDNLGIPIIVVDHHHNRLRERSTYFNPVAIDPTRRYPSTTWVLKELLELPLNLPIIIGAAGDCMEKIVRLPQWEDIKKYLAEKNLDWNTIIKASELLDSNYKIGSRRAVVRAVEKLLSYDDSLEMVLGDEEWNKYRLIVEEELDRLLSSEPAKIVGNVLVYNFKSKYHLASMVTRRLSLLHEDKVVVVVFENEVEELCQIYVRSWTHNLISLIDMLVEEGYNAGGKRSVAALIVECDKIEDALSSVVRLLSEIT